MGFMGLLNRLPAVIRLCNHLHIATFFNETAQAGSNDTMVIRQ
jgi:hypothetical protein